MIKVENLKKSYRQLKALDGVSLQVKKGKVTGLVGPNGCGKTTLIKLILGLILPDDGEILVNQKTIFGDWAYRRDIGYMPQNPDFPGNLTIHELLNLLEDIRGEKAPMRDELLRLFDISNDGGRSFGILSGGTKQKVAVVAAFMFKPSILILDEPTVGLDPISAMRFKDLTRQFADEGSAVLLVSHIMSEMEQMVDRMIFILDGKVSFQGSTKELREKAGHVANLETAIVNLLKERP